MRDDSVCCAAGSLIGALSSKLLREMQDEERGAAGANGAEGGEQGGTASAATAWGRKKKGLGGRDEVCIGGGGGRAVTEWQRWWIPPLLRTLLSPGREKNGAGNYALPPLLKQDGASIVPLLEGLVEGGEETESGGSTLLGTKKANDDDDDDDGGGAETQKRKQRKTNGGGGGGGDAVGGGSNSNSGGGSGGSGGGSVEAEAEWGERRSAALVALLRAARATSLLDPACLARVSPAVSAAAGRSAPYEVPTELLERAVVCRETRTRCDALEMVCIDGRKASLPGALELDLLRRALPVCLRGDSAAFRNALGSMMRSLLAGESWRPLTRSLTHLYSLTHSLTPHHV